MAEDEGESAMAAYAEELAVPLSANSFGTWDGACFYLRSFPVWYRWRQVPSVDASSGRPESGVVNGVSFEQSMGRMVLWFPLEGPDAQLTEEELFVEMSTWELRVSVGADSQQVRGKPTGRKIDALSGELWADIRRRLSWWDLTQDEAGSKWLTVYLTKALHKAWKCPWYADPLNPHRKMTFGWTAHHMLPQKTEDEKLTKCLPGHPQDLGRELCTGMTAERVCTGIDEEEDEWYAYILIHLDEEALEVATDRVPMEELFAADVRSDAVELYLRNDGFGLCSGRLRRACVPEMAMWELTTVRRRNLPKGSGIRCPAFYNPVLRIRLLKAEGSQGLWGGVFESLQKPDFEPPRERMSWTERVQRALVLSPGAPLKQQVKTERALKMCTRIECSQDTVTQRATITLHLDEGLEELAYKFKLDLTTFFALKVAERMVEVSVIADAEFTMCVGRLGGAVEPTKTSWEITRERNAPGDEKDHLALKVGLAKAAGFKERWDEVFTRMEPWEVSESLHAALALPSAGGAALGEAN